MRILFVSSMALFSDTRFGGAKRLTYFARELARSHDLHLLCLDGCREWPKGARPPEEFPQALYLPLGGKKPLWRRATSVPVDIDEEVARHKAAIDAFLDGRSFDATLFAFPLSLSLLGKSWDSRLGKVTYLEDDLLLESYRRAGVAGGKRLSGLKNAWRHRQAAAYFRQKLAKASAFICISAEEGDVAHGYFPGLAVPILKYGLPLEEYPRQPAPEYPMTMGFIGNFRHEPNLDAALWMAGELFPYLEGQVPGVRLVLAGRYIPDSLRALCASRPKIQLQENVSDLSRFYRSIGVFVNPIRLGRGLRTKVVEAAAFGRPVLSTPLGAEGLEELDLRPWRTAPELAAALADLGKPARYRELADANRKTVEARFTMEKLGEDLAGILKP
jgi:glycosyltransferase involved in cell wall biosynthesis